MKKLIPKKDNKEDRMNFIKYWASYIKNNPDEVWSRQQNILINSQIQNARYFKMSRKDYLYLKITQQEPFKMLYTSISGYGIFCINNQDILWGCQISVKPAENFELRLDYTSTAGKNGEFYLKPFRNKLEARAVFNF